MKAAASGWCQRAVHKGQQKQGQGRRTGQVGRAVPAERAAADRAGVAQKILNCSDTRELRKLVDHQHPELRVAQQCVMLGLTPSTLYYRPVRQSTRTWPGSTTCTWRITAWQPPHGRLPGPRRVSHEPRSVTQPHTAYEFASNLPETRTTIAGVPSLRFACLVDLREITAVDEAWATDNTYITCRRVTLPSCCVSPR